MPPDAVSCRKRAIHRILLPLFAAFLLTACVTAPVQQMSDARQAIQSAMEAGAARRAPELLQEAHDLVEAAERALAARDYRRAGELAARAREKAIAAREASLASGKEERKTE